MIITTVFFSETLQQYEVDEVDTCQIISLAIINMEQMGKYYKHQRF